LGKDEPAGPDAVAGADGARPALERDQRLQ
jgi:hypothetical protein